MHFQIFASRHYVLILHGSTLGKNKREKEVTNRHFAYFMRYFMQIVLVREQLR
jgi:hypothetical protein